jgi:hypothetical protein
MGMWIDSQTGWVVEMDEEYRREGRVQTDGMQLAEENDFK